VRPTSLVGIVRTLVKRRNQRGVLVEKYHHVTLTSQSPVVPGLLALLENNRVKVKVINGRRKSRKVGRLTECNEEVERRWMVIDASALTLTAFETCQAFTFILC
jgi:hypothetical protein